MKIKWLGIADFSRKKITCRKFSPLEDCHVGIKIRMDKTEKTSK